jgi:hypothetical protein
MGADLAAVVAKGEVGKEEAETVQKVAEMVTAEERDTWCNCSEVHQKWRLQTHVQTSCARQKHP